MDITPPLLAVKFAPVSQAAILALPPPTAPNATLVTLFQQAAVRLARVNVRTALMLQLARVVLWATI